MGRYDAWSKARKFEAAEQAVLDEGMTQRAAAEKFGVSRQHLNVRLRDARRLMDERVDQAKREVAARADVASRPFPSFKVWFDRYFGGWVCPDCGVHHQLPDFHLEIVEALEAPDARRVLVNIPPYHSKSTLISVFHTVYDICRDRDTRTAIVSKSSRFAETFIRQIQEILTNPELYENSDGNLIDDYGPFKPDGQATWNAQEIIVSGRTRAEKDATVTALGFGTQIYGKRFDKIKFDDVATLENSNNPDRVASMLEWIDKEALSRVGKSGQAVWVGTRVSAGDIYYTLGTRPGYKVIRYPALIDAELEQVLWPEHFPFSQVLIHKSEMKPADFQLVYQNVDVPGLGASFTQDILDQCKDTSRVFGHWDPRWRLIAGLDPAGANKSSGFTAFCLLGVDLETGKRFLVETYAQRAMKAPQIKDKIFEWVEQYPLFEFRVESNGLQSQLIQYNQEVIQHLARRGVRVTPHHTHTNKWDPQFGVESMATLFHAEMVSIPWANAPTAQRMQPLLDELIGFPMAQTSDRVMSFWFADLGVRDLLHRAHMPMFSHARVPNRIKRRRRIVDFQSQSVDPVPVSQQRPGHLSASAAGYRRMTIGSPTDHAAVREFQIDEEPSPPNIDPRIWHPE
jgi:hypothetical protein